MNKNDERDLKELIIAIQKQYAIFNNKWKQYKRFPSINMKRKKVKDVFREFEIFLYISEYRKFLNNYSIQLLNINKNQKISSRIKTPNSIIYKLNHYRLFHEKGEIPLKKCINDLFGIRIIFDTDIDYKMINEYIKKEFPNLKCIESKKREYYAMHIYFGNNDNTNFQWELQIWDKHHEESNFKSHTKHKQDYIKWERDNEEV